MKIQVAPPFVAANFADLPRCPAPAIREVDAKELAARDIDLSRHLRFGKDSIIDESAVLLVELSVLVYARLNLIQTVLFPHFSTRVHAFDSGLDRTNDFWSSRGRFPIMEAVAGWSRNLPAVKPCISEITIPTTPLGSDAFPRTTNTTSGATDPDRPARVLVIQKDDNVLIIFRGTHGLGDWITDFKFIPKYANPWPLQKIRDSMEPDRPPNKAAGWRHSGFQNMWESLRESVGTQLQQITRDLGKPPQLYLGGHSLGGALATLAAVDLAAAHYPVARVVTIGSPRVGGKCFKELYRRTPAAPASESRTLPDVTTRWVHGSDLVTLIPPPIRYSHVVKKDPLTPKDRIPLEEYIPKNLFDFSAVTSLIERAADAASATPSPQIGGVKRWMPEGKQPRAWGTLLRNLVGQAALWVVFFFPGLKWSRFLYPLLPVTGMGLLFRSGFRHNSMKYLGFMPPTALFRTMMDVCWSHWKKWGDS